MVKRPNTPSEPADEAAEASAEAAVASSDQATTVDATAIADEQPSATGDGTSASSFAADLSRDDVAAAFELDAAQVLDWRIGADELVVVTTEGRKLHLRAEPLALKAAL